MIGFLGIDPITEPTSSELYVIVIPRYEIRTDILVTTKHGQEEYVIENGIPLKIVMQSDLMGCSDGRLYIIVLEDLYLLSELKEKICNKKYSNCVNLHLN